MLDRVHSLHFSALLSSTESFLFGLHPKTTRMARLARRGRTLAEDQRRWRVRLVNVPSQVPSQQSYLRLALSLDQNTAPVKEALCTRFSFHIPVTAGRTGQGHVSPQWPLAFPDETLSHFSTLLVLFPSFILLCIFFFSFFLGRSSLWALPLLTRPLEVPVLSWMLEFVS